MSDGAEHPTLKRFTYWDNSKCANGEMLLSTVASTIAFADAELLKKKNLDVVRCPWIGCEVGAVEVVPFKDPFIRDYGSQREPRTTRTVKTYEMFLEEQQRHSKLMLSQFPKPPDRQTEVLTAYVKSGCERPCGSVRVSPGLKPKKQKTSKPRLIALHKKQFGECHYCWNPTRIEDWTIDHVVARSIGGDNSAKNLVGACRECNTYKGSLPVEIFEVSEYLRRKREAVEIPITPTPDPSP